MLAVHIDAASGCLTMTGRLDTRSTPLLYDAVSALLATDQPEWTMDVTGLTVADHAGLRAIVGAYHRAVRHGRRITVQGASPGLQHALRRLRLDRHVLPAEPGPPVNKVTG
jgi:anti-anti-sigma factor